jgi:hypothetical protein
MRAFGVGFLIHAYEMKSFKIEGQSKKLRVFTIVT